MNEITVAFIEKLWDLFNAKRISLRKAKWEIKPWGEYAFQCACEEEWAFYLNSLGCEVLDGGAEALAEKWNFSDKINSICIRDPEDRRKWVFVPREIAKKALVLGSLP